MRRLKAGSSAVLLAFATAAVSAAAGSGAAARAAVPADVPTHTPGVAAAPGGAGFDVVYRTSAESVALRTLVDGTWSEPVDLGGRLTTGPAATYAGGAEHVFGRGLDGRLWQRTRVSGTWQTWTRVDDLPISAAPAAAGHADGRVDVFVRDAGDALRTRTYRPGSGWGAWSSLGGVLYSAPAAVVTGDGAVRVVATGKDYAVWTRTLTGSAWSAWSSLGGRTFGPPAVAADPSEGRTWVVVRDGDTHRLRLRVLSGSWGDWQVVGGLHVDGPAAAFTGGKVAVVARGRDGAFWHRTITGTTWSEHQVAWIPGAPPTVPSSLRGKNVTRIPTTGKVAALTFDGAWSSAGLFSIRATLQRENVPATFFLVGDFARGFPVGTNLLAGGGFRIGNHSDNHPDFTKIDDATARAEVTNARTAIFNVNGAEPRPLFRFPYGAYTASDITLLNGLGYVPVGWSVDSLGWQGTSGGQTAAKVADRVLAAAQPGMIVLMHVGDNPDDGTILDADALPRVIQGLRDRGYSFTTLDALLR